MYVDSTLQLLLGDHFPGAQGAVKNQQWNVSARHGTSWQGTARHKLARFDLARHGTFWHGTARLFVARHVASWHGTWPRGTARGPVARHAATWPGTARQGYTLAVAVFGMWALAVTILAVVVSTAVTVAAM